MHAQIDNLIAEIEKCAAFASTFGYNESMPARSKYGVACSYLRLAKRNKSDAGRDKNIRKAFAYYRAANAALLAI